MDGYRPTGRVALDGSILNSHTTDKIRSRVLDTCGYTINAIISILLAIQDKGRFRVPWMPGRTE